MSTNYLNNHLSTITTKRKTKYPITKPSYLISDTTNKIIQSIEKKLRMKKSSSSKSTNSKPIANKSKSSIPINKIIPNPSSNHNNNHQTQNQNLKGKKARSTNRLTSSTTTTVTASPGYISQTNSKTPKHNSISMKKPSPYILPVMSSSINTITPSGNGTINGNGNSTTTNKISLIKKRDCSLENNMTMKSLMTSSSYHMKHSSNKSKVISPKRDSNNRLLTSASFTGNKPSLDSFTINTNKQIKNKREINVKTIPLNDSRKDDINIKDSSIGDKLSKKNINANAATSMSNSKNKTNTPLQVSKQTAYVPVNSLKNMKPNSMVLNKGNKVKVISESNITNYDAYGMSTINDHQQETNKNHNTNTITTTNVNSNIIHKTDGTILTAEVFKTIDSKDYKFASNSPIRKAPIQYNIDTGTATSNVNANDHMSNLTNVKSNDQSTGMTDLIAQTTPNTSLGTSHRNMSTINKRIVNIDSYSKPGFSAPGIEKINQDNYFITQHFLNEPEHYLLGICDGHGNSGHLASEFIVNSLPDKLLDLFLYEKPNTDINQNLIEGFLRLHNELIDNHDIDTRFSGTTCISTIISKEKIICANLGDSRAVLGKYIYNQWKAVNLSRDHKASELDESTRIIKRGGRIASYIDEETKESVGPQRVWLKEADIPGLAMTRSFGDQIAHCVGVTCEPEIKEYLFQGGEKFIVLGSDGIWEFIDSVECVHIIKDYYLKGDVNGACNAIIEEAFNRWTKDQNVVDDITVIIAFLD